MNAFDLVAPFVSTDEERPHLCRPARHAGHVVATDGHTMAVVRHVGPADVRELNQATHHAPPWQQVTPAAPVCVGEITRSAVEPLRHFPSRWLVVVTLAPEGRAWFTAMIPARTGKHGKVLAPRITTVKRSVLDGFEELRVREPVGIDAAYLVRCFDLATKGFLPSCHVHATGPLDPVVFAPEPCATRDELVACPQFAVTMPVRI